MSDKKPPSEADDERSDSDAGPHALPYRSPAPAVPRSLTDMLIGVVLSDRYRLTRRVSEDKTGWIFAAEDLRHSERVTLQLLPPSLCRSHDRISRFRREARAATQLGSPHIVDVTDFGTTEQGIVFFVMTGLDGASLHTTLEHDGPLSWPRVVHIAGQLCSALQLAHEAGLVHGRLRPANICQLKMGDDPDFIKILDFGIAQLTPSVDLSVAMHGEEPESPEFLAPEQLLGGAFDYRADIYSVGACAYALLTGRPPSTASTWLEVALRIASEDPAPPSKTAIAVPQWLDAVIVRCLRRDPDKRYRSMSALADALAR